MNFCRKHVLFLNPAGLLLAFSLLTGCANMNSQFTCPMKPGQMCSSLDEVNTMVDQGRIGGSTNTADNNKNMSAFSENSAAILPYPIAAMTIGEPLRYGESVLRIWVAPYEDKAGNYYQPNLMYTVIQPSHWIGNPVKAINNND